ncbi:MAG: hypothetical protein K9K39_07155 [Desulfohalobiaceae bacterium]|nr:hypothetical protein [Desulfohalobiaceae bacterium]
MAKKPSRPSLLDLEPKQGTSERRRLAWMLWQRPRFEELVRSFEATYGERPVFWRCFMAEDMDLYLTHPVNALAVHRQSGELILDSRFYSLAWGSRIDSLAPERRRHISPQVCALLDGRITAQEWRPEVMQRFFLNRERVGELETVLRQRGLGYCLEKEWHKGVIRVFGTPQELNRLFHMGLEQGLLALEKT